jgi:hypothetical protein
MIGKLLCWWGWHDYRVVSRSELRHEQPTMRPSYEHYFAIECRRCGRWKL